MTWVVLTDDLPPAPGGVATWTDWATRALATRGPVRVYCRDRPGLVAAEGIEIRPVRARSFARRGPLALAMAAASDIRSAEGVLCTTWPVARFVSRLAPVHVVGHGSDLVRPADPRALARVWARCRGWTVSAHLQRVAQGRGLQADVLPVPVPATTRHDLGDRWLFVGRAVHGKGGERFVRWCAEAGVTGEVVGDGPALAVWRAEAARHGADVVFTGALDRAGVDAAYRRARAVFLPSHRTLSEGLGLTLMEARARGIPVVGTPSGGIPEALGDEGLLVSPKSHGADIASRLEGASRPASPGGPEAFLERLLR
ncbi:MAG: glycosyltransferase family 4 protein [Alphaproteobacteria bacterium]|nr:glycosyltransferase family 4 protein [Alphaproteobacteria bacterium]MCB9690987.1 glycosyltransferase family 4 protein [Alphaproteobacteria bacterium]